MIHISGNSRTGQGANECLSGQSQAFLPQFCSCQRNEWAKVAHQAETNPVKGIQNVSLSPFRRSGDVFDPNVDVPHQMWHCASWWIIRASSMVANVQCACAMPMANASSLQVSLGSIDRRNYRSELSELSEPSHYRSYRSYRSGLDSVR